MSRQRGILDKDRSLFMSSARADITARKEIIEKYVQAGANKAEAERLMLLELFRREIRFLVKKVPVERLQAAINEALVEEVMES
jgi:hypothetical protein